MRRVKTKLPDELQSHLLGLSRLRSMGLHDYCRQVVDIFVHGALVTTRRSALNIPFVDMQTDSGLGKCTNDLDLLLEDAVEFDTAGGVHALAVLNDITASEVLRNILSIHAYGASHVASMRMQALPTKGNAGGVR